MRRNSRLYGSRRTQSAITAPTFGMRARASSSESRTRHSWPDPTDQATTEGLPNTSRTSRSSDPYAARSKNTTGTPAATSRAAAATSVDLPAPGSPSSTKQRCSPSSPIRSTLGSADCMSNQRASGSRRKPWSSSVDAAPRGHQKRSTLEGNVNLPWPTSVSEFADPSAQCEKSAMSAQARLRRRRTGHAGASADSRGSYSPSASMAAMHWSPPSRGAAAGNLCSR